MKKLLLIVSLVLTIQMVNAQTDLNYYLPDINYDPAVPTPEAVFGFQVGEWHASHTQLARYMEVLAESSDRAMLYEYGRSHERRPMLHLVITSPENQRNLETIRERHLTLTDPARSADIDISDMPAVVLLGYGVHGNEPSSQNAVPPVAYYFAAGQSPEIDDILKNTIIIIDPALNPDGTERYASWVNRHRSRTLVTDPANREFNDVWPGSRTNHYWFDLNRDWLPVQHPESRGRVEAYHRWRPNINTDHHEFGSNSTFFFQPGIPSRVNPLTPQRTNDLTMEVGYFHARAFDEIGTLYYTEESFDDFYYGKGSSYPDVNGSIGILFEQAGLRGHRRETIHGTLDFAFTIKNQVVVSLSTVEAAQHLRLELLEHLRWFYSSAMEEASREPVRYWVFGDENNRAKNALFKDILNIHEIEMYELARNVELEGQEFKPGSAWVVPVSQPQFRLVQSLFTTVREFEDSLFYDISTWTLPLAFNMPYSGVSNARLARDLAGSRVEEINLPQGSVTGNPGAYAWVFSWDEFYAPRALYLLQNHGVRAKVATQSFTVEVNGESKEFVNGSIMIPSQSQEMSAERLYELLENAALEAGVDIYAVASGLTRRGIDLGSGSFANLRKPEVLLVVGPGTHNNEAGEVWHLLDQHFLMPVTKVEVERVNGLDLERYNTIILVNGNYNGFRNATIERMKTWVRNGGVIIGLRGANKWLADNDLTSIEFRDAPREDEPDFLPYAIRTAHYGTRRIPGSIFMANIDTTHPLGYGYTRNELPVYVAGLDFAEPASSPFANPLMFVDGSLRSGYVYGPYENLPDGSAGIIVNTRGGGAVVSFLHNPNFRGFWFGTNPLFMNAIFFGHMIRN
jgi:hypothetical protein